MRLQGTPIRSEGPPGNYLSDSRSPGAKLSDDPSKLFPAISAEDQAKVASYNLIRLITTLDIE